VALEELRPSGETALLRAVEHVLEVAPRRSVVVVLSDFFDHSLDLEFAMRQLATRRLEVSLLHVLDPWEIQFPFQNLTLFTPLETGRPVLAEAGGDAGYLPARDAAFSGGRAPRLPALRQ